MNPREKGLQVRSCKLKIARLLGLDLPLLISFRGWARKRKLDSKTVVKDDQELKTLLALPETKHPFFMSREDSK